MVEASPAICVDGTIYVGSTDQYFYALNPDGSLKWKFETGSFIISSEDLSWASNLSKDEFLKLITKIVPDSVDLSAIDLKNFKISLSGAVSSAVIDLAGNVYFGSLDSYFYSLTNDGILRWKFKTKYPILSSPAIGNDGTIYFGSLDSNIYAIGKNNSYNNKTFSETMQANYVPMKDTGLSLIPFLMAVIFIFVSFSIRNQR